MTIYLPFVFFSKNNKNENLIEIYTLEEKMDNQSWSLCKESFSEEDPAVNVKRKGLTSLVRISSERGLDELHRYFSTSFVIFLHLSSRI